MIQTQSIGDLIQKKFQTQLNQTLELEALIQEAVIRQLNQTQSPKACAVKTQEEALVPIGVSARHVHVTREHLDILYGKNYQLKVKKELMGGQFAAHERVIIISSSLRVIENVTILGPERPDTQVEISKTDAVKLGLVTPIRQSGDVNGSAPITIVGPNGAVSLEQGCIVAQRHIHMNPQDAVRMNVVDKQIVAVETLTGDRRGRLNHVLIRVHPTFRLEMHIDTDEANALGIKCNDKVKIVP